jgi:ADP-heptose:LPS heptosyltransferase
MKRPTVRIVACGALGDALLTTPSFRALKQQGPSPRIVVYCTTASQYELYRRNPHIDRLVPPGRLNRCERWARTVALRTRFRYDIYGMLMPSMFCAKPATELIAGLLDARLADRRLEMFLSAEEDDAGRRLVASYDVPVVIHVTSRCSSNQHWPIDRWTELVRRNPHLTFVQLGLGDETRVPGAVDLRGKLDVRTAVAVLKHSRSFVGVVSFFAHATNAFDVPGVVLFGPSTPVVWAHPNNRNLNLGLPCAPCIDLLGGRPCPYGAPCLSEITVEQVQDALNAQLARTAACAEVIGA